MYGRGGAEGGGNNFFFGAVGVFFSVVCRANTCLLLERHLNTPGSLPALTAIECV